MRKPILLALLLCLALAAPAAAERKKKQEIPELPDLFKSIRKGVVCLTAADQNGDDLYATGIVVKGEAEKAVVAVSLTYVTKGYSKFKLHSDLKKNYLSAKKGKDKNDFAHNIRFLEFAIKGSRKRSFGSFADRALPIASQPPVPGQKVFIACAMPNAQPAMILPAEIGNEVRPEGRDAVYFTLDFDVPFPKRFAFLGAPVVNRMGEIVGIYNVDMNPAYSKLAGAITDTPLVHPAAALQSGLNADDKFPKRKGLPLSNRLTGHWLPVRFGPLTPAWREAMNLPSSRKGVVVTYVYPDGSDCGLRVGDIIVRIEGVPVKADNWNEAGQFTIIFMRLSPSDKSGDTWRTSLKVIRDGEETDVDAAMPSIESTSGAPYNCMKLGIQFVELGRVRRIMNDFSEALSGVLANRVAGRRLTLAVVRGLMGTVVKEVNGRKINSLDDLKDVIENSGAFTFRFLVLDTRDFQYKYITITPEQ